MCWAAIFFLCLENKFRSSEAWSLLFVDFKNMTWINIDFWFFQMEIFFWWHPWGPSSKHRLLFVVINWRQVFGFLLYIERKCLKWRENLIKNVLFARVQTQQRWIRSLSTCQQMKLTDILGWKLHSGNLTISLPHQNLCVVLTILKWVFFFPFLFDALLIFFHQQEDDFHNYENCLKFGRPLRIKHNVVPHKFDVCYNQVNDNADVVENISGKLNNKIYCIFKLIWDCK